MGWLDGFLGLQQQQETPEQRRQKLIADATSRMKQLQTQNDAFSAPNKIQMQQTALQQVIGGGEAGLAEVGKIGAQGLGYVGRAMSRLTSGTEAGTTNAYNQVITENLHNAGKISDEQYWATKIPSEMIGMSPSAPGPGAAILGNLTNAAIDTFAPQAQRAREALGYKDPWAETKKAIVANPADPALHGMDVTKAAGWNANGPLGGIISPAFAGGMVVDVFNDPLSYLTNGFDAGTKGAVAAESKAAELAGQVWDKPAL